MTGHRVLVGTLSLLLVVGLFAPSAAMAAGGWFDNRFDQGYYQQQQSGWGKLFSFGVDGKKIARIALTGAGTLAAGLFGSQFGMVGTVVGGVAGYMVSKFIADKVFGGGPNCDPYVYGHEYHGITGFFRRIKDKILGRDPRKGPPALPPVYGGPNPGQFPGQFPGHFSGTRGSGDLSTLRQGFYQAMISYKRALESGTDADKQSAKTAYDSAREAYFQAKMQQSGSSR